MELTLQKTNQSMATAEEAGSATGTGGTPPTFEKGDLVLIDGLQSAAGKKLNGKHGIILGPLNKDGRYPVRMYETGEHAKGRGWDDTVVEKKSESANVHKFSVEYPDDAVCKRCNEPCNQGDGMCRKTHAKDKVVGTTMMTLGDLSPPQTYTCFECFARFDMALLEGTNMMDHNNPGDCDRDPTDISSII